MSLIGVTQIRGRTKNLLQTGQTTCYHVGDDGDYEAGFAKAYNVLDAGQYAGTSNIEVASYAGNQISFTAPNTVSDGANGLAHILTNDVVVIKGSASNDGVYTVTAGGVAGSFTVAAGIVDEAAGRYVKLYKRAAHSNNCVQDLWTGKMWSRTTSNAERVGVLSNGTLNWYDVATLFPLHPAAADLAIVMPGNTLRIVGGAAEVVTYHVGDLLKCGAFANAVNNLPGYYVVSVTVNGADLDIILDPVKNTLIAEAAAGARTIGLETRSVYCYAAGARTAGLSGHTDWRIPNSFEGYSIARIETPTAVPDPVAFPGWPASNVATSNTTANAPANSGFVSYLAGTATAGAKTSPFFCALIRG